MTKEKKLKPSKVHTYKYNLPIEFLFYLTDKIQNTMMTVVGVGAMAYLSSLEQMGGGS